MVDLPHYWGIVFPRMCGNPNHMFNLLVLPVAVEKLEGPCPCLPFLGFELDSEAMVIRLPHSKLVELQHLIKSWESRRSCTRKDLKSLVGKLAHASQVVQPGRTFMRKTFELLAGMRSTHHHICLSKAFRSDLQWWATFLEVWNGVTMMQCGSQSSGQASHYVWTDASGHSVAERGGRLLVAGYSCSGSRRIRRSGRLCMRRAFC